MIIANDKTLVLALIFDSSFVRVLRAMQQKLVELGYLSGTPDGNFGKKTVEAIKKYQTDMGLESTGIADDATQRLILTGQLPKN